MNRTHQLALVGLVSGVVSFAGPIFLKDIYWTAGVVFGIAILAYFVTQLKTAPVSAASMAWIAGSVVSYYAAVRITLMVGTAVAHGGNALNFPGFFIGGLVGGALVLLAFHYFLRPLNLNQYAGMVALSGLLAVSGPAVLRLGESAGAVADPGSFLFTLVLYVVWQTGMAFAMGTVVNPTQKKQLS